MAALNKSLRLERRGKDFRRLAEEVRKALETAIQENADDLQAVARRNAPVRTGFLRDHINVVKQGPLHVDVTSEAPYASFVEFGTRYMAAQPYLMPAIEEVRPRAEDRVRSVLQTALNNTPTVQETITHV